MPIHTVSGDPMLTKAQTLAFAHNAKGRTELGALETRLMQQYPPAFASFHKVCRNGRVKPGDLWIWRESQPHLTFLTVRETAVGAIRIRFVESVMMTLARDYRLHNLTSLAIAPVGTAEEWATLRAVVDYWLKSCPLSIVVYDVYIPGQKADERL